MEGKIFMPPPPKELKKPVEKVGQTETLEEEQTPAQNKKENSRQSTVSAEQKEPQKAPKAERKKLNINWGLYINIGGFVLSALLAVVCLYFLIK